MTTQATGPDQPQAGRDGERPPAIRVLPSERPVPTQERARRMTQPGFGRVFTDHMVTARWTRDRGWQDATLQPYGPLALDPAAVGLHYGQSIFEGFKAYRQPDGGVAAFRPEANALRFQASSRRLCLPELPVQLFVDAVDALVRQDRDWVPDDPRQSLYLRPLMLATEPQLVVRPADEVLFVLIAFTAGDYFPRGVEPVSMWVSQEYVRASPGGTGAAKCGANYVGTLLAQTEAAAHGCDQVVWLDAVERRWVEELGGMNLYVVRGRGAGATVMTPALTGTLLPGVTRDSLLTLAAGLGLRTEQGRLSVDEWRRGCAADPDADGAITEVFACGTAAVVTPVASVVTADDGWAVGDGSPGEVTMRLREELVGIQTGRLPDPHHWLHRIC
jgi:branched-chain amino acid aminotransferase